MLDLQIGHLCKLSSLIAFSLLMNERSQKNIIGSERVKVSASSNTIHWGY